jgi:hypothetical protein
MDENYMQHYSRCYYYYNDRMYAYNYACYFHPYSYGKNINQVNHFQYVTCEIIEQIIEWAMISKCFFGADFAKCKKIIVSRAPN